MTRHTVTGKTRRIHLTIGRPATFHENDKGDSDPRLMLHGMTESGADYEVWLKVDDWNLGLLAVEIRDHFVERTKREKAQREFRERALRMPPEAP